MTISLSVWLQLESLVNRDVDKLMRDRREFHGRVMRELRSYEPMIKDAGIKFYGLTGADLRELRRRCLAICPRFRTSSGPVYTLDDIRVARFVPLLINGQDIDSDKDWVPFNTYPKRLCETCGSVDLTVVPNPYKVRRPTRTRNLHSASPGLFIVTSAAWNRLSPRLSPWVKTGQVEYVDSVERADLIWVQPTTQVGSFLDVEEPDRCRNCNRVTGRGMGSSWDVIHRDLISDYEDNGAPIALAGNWFGHVTPARPSSLLWYILISGELHETMRKMRISGLVPADRVIQTAAQAAEFLP